jgi:hypothetical protein
VTTPSRERDYQSMMAALADVARRRDHGLEGAEQAYQTSTARAAGELARAEGDAAEAERWAHAAAVQVDDVDREASRLWEQLRRVPGVRQRTLGELPEPAAVEPLPRAALESSPEPGAVARAPRQSARTLLARAAERIDITGRPPRRRAMPRWTFPLLPLVGALAAGLTGLIAAGLITTGAGTVPAAGLMRGFGWGLLLLAPSAGVPLTAAWAHRRLLARLDVIGIALTLLGGMLAAALMAANLYS